MPVQLLPLADVVLGLALLTTIGVAATRSPLVAQAPHLRLVGCFLVAVPLPLVVAFRLASPSSPLGGQGAFIAGVLAFALGALLVLSASDDSEEGGSEPEHGPAPWWPEFEREFRAYARRQPRDRAKT